jgi:hypothetical protein
MKPTIDHLLEKYWDGMTTLDEEKQLKDYFNSDHVDDVHKSLSPLFAYYKHESEVTTDFVPDLSFTNETSKPKVRYLVPKIIGIAASLLLLFTVTYQQFDMDEKSYNNKYTEVENPDEALAIAIEALGFLGNKYNKGTTSVSKGLKNLEKTDVFTLDN